MRQGRKSSVMEHLQENLGMYVLVTAIFTVGIIAGALSVRMLHESQVSEINQVFFSFVDYLNVQKPLNQAVILQRSLLLNGIFVLLFWICGSFFFGFIITAGLIFYRGFTIGFTVGFLAQQNAMRGVLFAMAAILPQNLLYVPVTIVAGMMSVSFSLLLLQRRFKKQAMPFGSYFMQFTLAMFLAAVFFAVGSLVETVVAPVLMQVVVSFI